MNIITFKYTKVDGKVSHRVISPVVAPSTMWEGTDLSELEAVDQVMYAQALGKLNDEHKAKILALQEEFDLKYKYRRFDPTKMSNIVTEAL